MRGHLRKRSANSWSIVLYLGRDPATGRKRYQEVSAKGTRKQAEKRLAELIHNLDTGILIKPSRLTLGDWVKTWLWDYAASRVRPRTWESYKGKLAHVVKHLGGIHLVDLRPAHLKAFYGKLLEGGLSASSVAQIHRIWHEALSDAVRGELLARNVTEAVSPPRPIRKEMRHLSAEEVGCFLEAAKASPYYPVFHLAVHTGMRRSELLGLRWRDLDLDMGTLSVCQVCLELAGGKLLYGEPKTAKGRRQVALTPASVLALKSYRERQEADRELLGKPLADDDLVFTWADASPIKPQRITEAFRVLARRLGFQGVRFHDLRHTHASLMLAQGVHPKIVSERLGHSSIVITLDIYSHVTPGLQEAAARRFEEALAPGIGKRLAKTPEAV